MLKKKRTREGGYQRKRFIGIIINNKGINNPYEHLYGKRFEDPKESLKGDECILNFNIQALKRDHIMS